MTRAIYSVRDGGKSMPIRFILLAAAISIAVNCWGFGYASGRSALVFAILAIATIALAPPVMRYAIRTYPAKRKARIALREHIMDRTATHRSE